MKDSRISMGMPVSIEILDIDAARGIDAAYAYFDEVDRRFSTYRDDSEVAQMNRDPQHAVSADLTEILSLGEKTREESGGFFDMRRPDGYIDPTGIVKGWAIQKAADLLASLGYQNFYIDVGGDVAFSGKNEAGGDWQLGIRSPFVRGEIVKAIAPGSRGVATSGSAARGDHIYNPHDPEHPIRDVVSITVVGPDIVTADRYATAAFAMGQDGIRFIEAIPGCEGYQISAAGIATMTSGFRALSV